MSKFDPVKFFKEMKAILDQFEGRIKKEVDEKIEGLKEEIKTTTHPPHPPSPLRVSPIGLLKKDIFLVDWTAKMTRILTDQETKDFSQELFNLMQKYGFDTLEAKRKKEDSNPPAALPHSET